MKPNGTTMAKVYPNLCSDFEYLLLKPTDWKEELKPCHKCNASKTKDTQ